MSCILFTFVEINQFSGSCPLVVMFVQRSQRIFVCSASSLQHMQVKMEYIPFTLLIHTRPQGKLVSANMQTMRYGRHPAWSNYRARD